MLDAASRLEHRAADSAPPRIQWVDVADRKRSNIHVIDSVREVRKSRRRLGLKALSIVTP